MSKQNNMRSLNWRQRGWRSVGWKNSDVTVEAPADSILHWDADIDAFSEQTGGVHTFNHAVLSPQYQLNVDGSYANVGAKPAVDVFGGKKWLRSCGAVTNLLPSGAEGLNDSRSGVTVSPDGLISMSQGGFMRPPYFSNTGGDHAASCEITEITGGTVTLRLYDGTKAYDATTSTPKQISASGLLASSSYTTMYLRNDSGVTITFRFRNPQITATSYPVPYVPPGVTQPASNATTTNGSWFANPDGSPLWHALDGGPETDGVELVTNGGFDEGFTNWTIQLVGNQSIALEPNGARLVFDGSADAGNASQSAMLPIGEYIVEFDVSEGSTGAFKILPFGSSGEIAIFMNTWAGKRYSAKMSITASNVFRVSRVVGQTCNARIDNISIQRIQPQPLTLATRVRMGVGSGDIPLVTILRVLDPSGSGAMQYVYENGVGEPTAGFSGKNHTIVSLSRGSIIRLIGQVNTAGTQFRSGYYLEGTSTAISWSDWAAYTGTLNPSTLYRLMLGYNNQYPMWFNKVTAWKKQVTDAEILEAMA